MATNESLALPFDSSKPFKANCIPYKYLTFTSEAKNKNRLMIQQKFNIHEECSICLESMKHKSVMYTPCSHRFHSKCMFILFENCQSSNYKCPLCRHNLLSSIIKLNSSKITQVIALYMREFNVVDAIANTVGANAVGANAVGANAVGANAVGANAVGTNINNLLYVEGYDDDDDISILIE
jgi:uncharacterized protein YjbI with pentapeptide repeats